MGDAVPAAVDDRHLVVRAGMAADRRVDRAGERIRVALDQRVVGLVDRAGLEGPLQHRVRLLALGDHHQARGADVETLHDALPLRHPGGRDPEAGAGQVAQHRRPVPAQARVGSDPDRLVDHDDVVVVVDDPQSLDRLRRSPPRPAARRAPTSSMRPGADPVGLAQHASPSRLTEPATIRSAIRLRDSPSIRATRAVDPLPVEPVRDAARSRSTHSIGAAVAVASTSRTARR